MHRKIHFPSIMRTFQNRTCDVVHISQGRNGKGAIYTWAAGNGGANLDNCNCDGYVSSIYTISITSISMDLEEAWYAERCTSIMAGTYGGDAPNPAVVS